MDPNPCDPWHHVAKLKLAPAQQKGCKEVVKKE